MRNITFAEATLEAMIEEMERDESVFVLGEDIARQGGIFGQFKGLAERFGFGRVLDTPISETAIVGAGIGAAMAGMRPVIEMHFADFLGVAMDEVFNQMAKIRYMFGGQTKIPVVVRAPDGMIRCAAAQHSQSIESWFLHIPGLKVVAPSNAADAKGLLKSAIRDDNPVIFFEHKILCSLKSEVPEEEHLIPVGKANIARSGKDITIICYSIMVSRALKAAEKLMELDIDAEVLDLRTLSPLDKETIVKSIAKTRRVLIAHEAVKTGGAGAEIAAVIAEEMQHYLEVPLKRLGAPFVPVPFSSALEELVRITSTDIVASVKEMCS